ncbi:MAG: SIS domain-containing protein [Planctomycetes bacterium]|nr:SIS domain-containing protein [Planctomycetota bacterium]
MNRDWQAVLSEHQEVVEQMNGLVVSLDAIVAALVKCLRAGGRVYTFGNGGSAADAQHIAGELLGRYKLDRTALSVLALTTDSSTLTAIANDLGYEQIFARQLEALLRPGDVAWAFSTSGNSPNIVAAVRVAAARGATVIGFAGGSGGTFAEHCTHLLRIPHTSADRIQEGHELAYHYVCERVEETMANDR